MSKAVSDMTRDELEAEIRDLRERIERLEENHRSVPDQNFLWAQLAESFGADVDDYSQDPMLLMDVFAEFVQEVETMLEHHQRVINDLDKDSPQSPDEAWRKVVQTARNKANGHDKLKLGVEDIRSATGYTERHCSNKIEDWGEEKDGADWQSYKHPAESRQGSPQPKRLVIDMDKWGKQR